MSWSGYKTAQNIEENIDNLHYYYVTIIKIFYVKILLNEEKTEWEETFVPPLKRCSYKQK